MKNSVKLNREFTYAYRKGAKIVTDYIVFYWYNNRQSRNKLGITVSATLGGAVVRNRVKRLIRAAYSARKDELKEGHNIIVVARSKMVGAELESVSRAMDYCIRKSGLL